MIPRRRRPAFAVAASEAPIGTLNTTPLIDVMLVLLVMFIVTVPAMTHSVRIDLPSDRPVSTEPEVRRLSLDATGGLFWDGAPIAEAALPARLAAFREARPDGVLQLLAEGEARYDDFDRVLAAVKRSGIERLAFVGNESYASAIAG